MNRLDWGAINSATAIPTATAAAAATSTTYDTSSSSASSELQAVTARLAATTLSADASDVPYPVSSHRISTPSRLATCRVPCSRIFCMYPHEYAPDSIIGQARMKLAKNLPNDITLEFVLEGYKVEMNAKDFMLLATQGGQNVRFHRMIDFPSESTIRMVYEPRNESRVSSFPAWDFSDTSSDRYATENPSGRSVSAPSLTSVARPDVRSDTPQVDVVVSPPDGFEITKNYLLQVGQSPEVCVLTAFLRSISLTQIALPKFTKVHFVFEGIIAQSSTEFMTYARNPNYLIDRIVAGATTHVYCKKRKVPGGSLQA